MRTLAFALAGCCMAATALAQSTAPATKIEPGLWELNVTMKSQSGQVEAAMKQAQDYIASLPAEQRKQVEEMMAAKGVHLSDKASTVQACISKEDAERGRVPQQAGDCTQQVQEQSSQSLKVKFSCNTQPPASGEAVVSFQGSRAYTSQALVDTVVAGQAQRINVDQKGRWLSADCGSVKALGS